jgi:Pyridine nucleotide-disulphide oxidoreductase
VWVCAFLSVTRPFTSQHTFARDDLRTAPGTPAASVRAHAYTPTTEYDYDLFTIGGGSGGVRASRFSSGYGAKTACVELPFAFISGPNAGGYGGTCVLRGCVPKKLVMYCSEYREFFHDSKGFGCA